MSPTAIQRRAGAEPAANTRLAYLAGFGSEFETESLPDALPAGQNSPQKPPYGLVSELISGSTFTSVRSANRRSYVFRIRPSVLQGRLKRAENGLFLTPPFNTEFDPNYLTWHPFKSTSGSVDFIDGIATIAGNGSPVSQAGMALHVYEATRSMRDRAFSNRDAEMVIVPHVGALSVVTEFGILAAGLGEIIVIPKGIKFRVELPDGRASGFVIENYGEALTLPERGVMGGHGLANAIDFLAPVAAYEDAERPTQLVHKFMGNMWATMLSHSPFDVVAWRGTLYPYKYDLSRIAAFGALNVDHPDPSSLMVLTSASHPVMGPNCDIMAFTPRWLVAEHTFRPPGYHRNAIAELIVVLKGGQGPAGAGGVNLHNNWTPHGPSTAELEAGREQVLGPQKVEELLLLVLESRFPLQVTEFAQKAPNLLGNPFSQWEGFNKRFAT